jgi:membrane protein
MPESAQKDEKRSPKPTPASIVKRHAKLFRGFFTETVWLADLASMSRGRAFLYRVARVLSLAGRGYFRDECSFRAAALTYTTILSIVPVLAMGFAMAKGLGFGERLRQDVVDPFLENVLPDAEYGPSLPPGEPVAPAGSDEAATAATPSEAGGATPRNVRSVIDEILTLVENTDVKALGALGALILVYTVLQLLGTIERSFNDIWGIERQRRFIRKVADYLTMVVITPIFLISATTLTAAAQTNAFVTFLSEDLRLEALIELLLRLAPLFSMWVGFTFLYMVMPNTRTRVTSAIIGGVVGGTLWQLAQVAHVKFQIGVAKYSALYSTFAALPIFLVWLYLSWAIVLIGAELAAAHQNEALHERTVRTKMPPHVLKEMLALRALRRVGQAFVEARSPLTSTHLASRLGFPEPIIEQVMNRLVETGILAPIGDERDTAYVPARDLDTVRVKDVLDALKGAEGRLEFPHDEKADTRAEAVLQGIDGAIESSEFNLTLRELVGARLDALPAGKKAARTLPPPPSTRDASGGARGSTLRGDTAAAERGEAERS